MNKSFCKSKIVNSLTKFSEMDYEKIKPHLIILNVKDNFNDFNPNLHHF